MPSLEVLATGTFPSWEEVLHSGLTPKTHFIKMIAPRKGAK